MSARPGDPVKPDDVAAATSAAEAEVAGVAANDDDDGDANHDGAEGHDDAPAEPTEVAASRPATPEERHIAELEAQVDSLSARLRQYSEAVDRVRGEFDASRNRMEREHARTLEGHKADAVAGLLGVVDSLDRGLNSLAGAETKAEIDNCASGLQIVRVEFERVLAELGLRRFDATGEVFNPERHQAVSTMPVTDRNLDGRVVQELSGGSLVGDRVLRPAVVVVGAYSEPASGDQPN